MCSHEHDHGAEIGPVPVSDSETRTVLRILQMDCPTEESLIRKKLHGVSGISSLRFNLMGRLLTVDHAPGVREAILEGVRSLGMKPELSLPNQAALSTSTANRAAGWWRLGIAGAAAFLAEVAEWTAMSGWVVMALALFAVLLSGLTTYRKGWIAITQANLNINALMSIAVTGAAVLGHWSEAAMVMVLFSLAEYIEARSMDRARESISRLMDLAPQTLWIQDEAGQWREETAAQVRPGVRVRARPGERIGLDGVVLSGATEINQAPITGESLPVSKGPGDVVYAGTINGMAEIEYEVRAGFQDTMLARIIHAVQEAQGSKAPIQRFVDRFARVYTPLVCVLAVLVAVIPPLFIAQALWSEWFYKALVLLVIACPCALVISTPVAVASGLTAAARRGILIKGGVYLEQGRNLRWLALDKTGTLTQGRPELTELVRMPGVTTTIDVPRIAASLAFRSDHPVSVAIARAYGSENPLDAVQGFEASPGNGVQARLNGAMYRLGSYKWTADGLPADAELAERIQSWQAEGRIVTVLADQHKLLGVFVVADALRESSAKAVSQLHGLGVDTVMLSGDSKRTAQRIAKEAGIDKVHAELLPEHKLDAIDEYSRRGLTGMVGDGINDAPALARADIGFAMGMMGTDTAIETADVALMDDDLQKIPYFIRLSRATHAILVQNITLALGIKLIFLALAVGGQSAMWMAVFADVGASLLVVGNSLRILAK